MKIWKDIEITKENSNFVKTIVSQGGWYKALRSDAALNVSHFGTFRGG
jgi:hypothetical protein